MTDDHDMIEAIRKQLTPERRARAEQAAARRQRGLILLMEDVWDPHNLMAISRTADAFGVQHIHYTAKTRFDTATFGMKSSARSHKWVDYIYEPDTAACIARFRNDGWHVVATMVSDRATSVYGVDWPTLDRLVLVIGNEHAGISAATAAAADTHVMIPMRGMAQSLNVSVATALVIGEITRQRDASNVDFALRGEAATAMTADLLRRAFF